MNVVELISKKRNGQTLSKAEIDFLIQGYTQGDIPDYQIAAWAMAVCFQGMSEQETADLTMAMVESGEQIDLSAIKGIKVDKHSTGGVGDKTTLVLAPLVAAAGVPVAKMSGRGLGHTGGTIDKLEAIRGFKVELASDQFIRQVQEISLAINAQTANLTPADKKLYALRDVTGTVDSIPLIASSIMSKKIATGSDAIVLDVKTGNGAFMKNEKDALALAQTMVSIGRLVERNTVAVISDMSQPLGYAVGNALEVKEAIQTLQGQGPDDLTELTLTIGTQMLLLSGVASTAQSARKQLLTCLHDGKALAKLKQWVERQGGDPQQIDQPELLPEAPFQQLITAEKAGWIRHIDTEEIGICAMRLGAGRATKDESIDHAVGLILHKKVGDSVKEGEKLLTLHLRNREDSGEIISRLQRAIQVSSQPVKPPTLLKYLVTPTDTVSFI
jgi:pyrimidine-nucleoside phosphorylase